MTILVSRVSKSWTFSSAALLFAFLCIPRLSKAEALPLQAEIKQSTKAYLQPLNGYDNVASTTDVMLTTGYRANVSGTGLNAKISPWIRGDAPYDVGGNRQSFQPLFELNEAWLEVVRDNWDIRAGNQILSWGSADAFNPTDVWNVSDFIDPFDQARLPLALAKLTLHPVEFEHVIAELIVSPQFRAHRLPIIIPTSATDRDQIQLTDSRWLVPTPSLVKINQTKTVPLTCHVAGAAAPQDWQFGGRLRVVRVKGWDLAFSASETTYGMPAIGTSFSGQVDQPGLPVDVLLQPIFYRVQTLGFDVSGVVGPFGLRLDIANRTAVTQNLPNTAPVTNIGVLGIDYTASFSKLEIYLNASFIAKDNPDYDNGTASLGVPDFEPWDRNVVLLLEARFLSHAKLGARGIASFVNSDGWISPYVSYTFAERFTAELGMDFFTGSTAGAFGQYADNTRVRSLLTLDL